MAFGKKKNDDESAPAGAPDDALAGAFAADTAPEPETDGGAPDPALAALDEPAAEAPPAEAPAPPADPLGGGGDALLNMFQSTEAAEDDRSVILDLAGEVTLADLLDDLYTVAAALGLAAPAEMAQAA